MTAQYESGRFRLHDTSYRYLHSSKIKWSETEPSDNQRDIAKQLGVQLHSGDTIPIAAARIHDAVADAIGDAGVQTPTPGQEAAAHDLGLDISCDSNRVAGARIGQAIQDKNDRENFSEVC